jgi:hypothetical protein
MLLQLNPPLRLSTPRGEATCHLVIDQGDDWDLWWVCFLDEDGTCWTYRNSQIKAVTNVTAGRPKK